MPWWWTFIDERDLYFHFKGLANFAAGEDRRGQNLVSAEARVTRQDGGEAGGLGARCLQNDHLAYCWIYDHSLMSDETQPSKHEAGLVLVVNGLKDGNYRVEFWDTYKGVAIETVETKSGSGTLKSRVPAIQRDVACKIKPIS